MYFKLYVLGNEWQTEGSGPNSSRHSQLTVL